MKKRLLSFVLVFALVVGIMPSMALALERTSGTCGTNTTWTFDGITGTLTIRGSGKMEDYAYTWESNAPWGTFIEDITSVVVSEGITHIGNGSFGGQMSANTFPNLSQVILPSTLESIGDYAFGGAPITAVLLPAALEKIGNYAFYGAELMTIELPTSVTTIGMGAFYGTKLVSIRVPSAVSSIGYDAFKINTLSSIEIDSENQNYTVDDNVLYDKG